MEHMIGKSEENEVVKEEGYEIPSFVKKTMVIGALITGLSAEVSAQNATTDNQGKVEAASIDPRLEQENNQLFNRVIAFEEALKKSIKKEGKSDLPRFAVLSKNEVLGRASYESEEEIVSVLKQDFEYWIMNNQSGKYEVASRSLSTYSALIKEKELGGKESPVLSVYTPLDNCVFLDIEKKGDTYTFRARKMNLEEKKVDVYTLEYTLTDRDKKVGGGYSSMLKIVEHLAKEVTK